MSAADIARLIEARLKPTEKFTPVKGTCQCATCRLSAGLRIIEGAVEEWMDSSEERSMSYAWLADEVEAVLRQPWWRPNRKRLREALRVAKGEPRVVVGIEQEDSNHHQPSRSSAESES